MVLSPTEWGDEDGDDEIFFFFTETSRVLNSYERIKVPRVARVCAVSSLSCPSVICWRLSFCLLLSGSALLSPLLCSLPRLLSSELEAHEGEGSVSTLTLTLMTHCLHRRLVYIRSSRQELMMVPGSSPAPPLPASAI